MATKTGPTLSLPALPAGFSYGDALKALGFALALWGGATGYGALKADVANLKAGQAVQGAKIDRIYDHLLSRERGSGPTKLQDEE